MTPLAWCLVLAAVASVAYWLGGMRGYRAGYTDGFKEADRQAAQKIEEAATSMFFGHKSFDLD